MAAKNEHGLTGPQEEFAKAVASGKPLSEAHRLAYPKSVKWAGSAIWPSASRIMAISKVSARVKALQALSVLWTRWGVYDERYVGHEPKNLCLLHPAFSTGDRRKRHSHGHSRRVPCVPRPHLADTQTAHRLFFDLSEQERTDLLALLDRAKRVLDAELQPQGYNIGINDGAAAGQTVPHLHVHLIPRFEGDLPDPRGGVRWVIPAKAKYW